MVLFIIRVLKTTAYNAGVYPSSFGMNEDAKNDGTL